MSDPFDLPALFRFELTEDEHVRLARLCSRDRMVKEMLALGAATAATSAAYREGRAASMFVAVFGVLAFLGSPFSTEGGSESTEMRGEHGLVHVAGSVPGLRARGGGLQELYRG